MRIARFAVDDDVQYGIVDADDQWRARTGGDGAGSRPRT